MSAILRAFVPFKDACLCPNGLSRASAFSPYSVCRGFPATSRPPPIPPIKPIHPIRPIPPINNNISIPLTLNSFQKTFKKNFTPCKLSHQKFVII